MHKMDHRRRNPMFRIEEMLKKENISFKKHIKLDNGEIVDFAILDENNNIIDSFNIKRKSRISFDEIKKREENMKKENMKKENMKKENIKEENIKEENIKDENIKEEIKKLDEKKEFTKKEKIDKIKNMITNEEKIVKKLEKKTNSNEKSL